VYSVVRLRAAAASRYVSRSTSAGAGSVESGAGNGLRPPNQNGSSRSGESNVPEKRERLVVRPHDVDGVAGAQAQGGGGADGQRDLARARRVAPDVEVVGRALAEQQRDRCPVGAPYPHRAEPLGHEGVDRHRRESGRDRGVGGGPVELTAAEHLQPGVRDRDALAAERRRQDRLASGVGVDRAGHQHADGEGERHDDGQPERALGHEPFEQESKGRHQRRWRPLSARTMIRRCGAWPGRPVAESCPRPPCVRGRENPLLGWAFEPRTTPSRS
jgi:hypothetical protein